MSTDGAAPTPAPQAYRELQTPSTSPKAVQLTRPAAASPLQLGSPPTQPGRSGTAHDSQMPQRREQSVRDEAPSLATKRTCGSPSSALSRVEGGWSDVDPVRVVLQPEFDVADG